VQYATSYVIYGRASGSISRYWNVTAPTVTYTDTGTAGTAASDIAGYGQTWLVKNNFELKHCDGGSPAGPCLIEGNVFDTAWCCVQNTLISLKPWNQEGLETSATIRNLTFRNNWGKHSTRAIVMAGSSGESFYLSGMMTNVVIQNNLFTDLSNTSGGTEQAILLNTGSGTYQVGTRSCIGCSFIHNSFFADTNDMKGPLLFDQNSSSDKATNLVIRDNVMARDSTNAGQISDGVWGVKSYTPGGNSVGTASWNAAVAGSSSADYNVWPDANCTTYSFDAHGRCDPDATVKAALVNYATCTNDTDISGCAFNGSSVYDNTASDKTDRGANIATIKAFTDIALSGNAAGSGGGGGSPPPPGRPRLRLRLRGA
jgi:hypothetical protein